MSKLVCVGKVLGAHGVRGDVKIASFMENSEDIIKFGPVYDEKGRQQWTITLGAWHKDHYLARLSGVQTREEGEALRGTKLYIFREKLPKISDEDTFYYTDLIGLDVQLEDGTIYGTIRGIQNYGAGDIVEVFRPQNGNFEGGPEMFSFTKANFPSIHLNEGYVLLTLPEINECENESSD